MPKLLKEKIEVKGKVIKVSEVAKKIALRHFGARKVTDEKAIPAELIVSPPKLDIKHPAFIAPIKHEVIIKPEKRIDLKIDIEPNTKTPLVDKPDEPTSDVLKEEKPKKKTNKKTSRKDEIV